MHETLTSPSTSSEGPGGIEALALRAEAWAGEPFLRGDEDPSVALAPGTAFRLALDAARTRERGDPLRNGSAKLKHECEI